VTRPGKLGLGVKNGDVSLGRASSLDDLGEARARLPLMAHEAASSEGRTTVADRPIKVSLGDTLRKRARSSAKRSPRLLPASACSSSMMTMPSDPNSLPASGWDSIGAICSGVVRRMSGGATRWRWRREGGVSPVRVSRPMGSPISAIGAARLRPISTAAFSGET
jgi:hypothetical protein